MENRFSTPIQSSNDRGSFYKDGLGIGKLEDSLANYQREHDLRIEGLRGSLNQTEVNILEATLEQAKQAGIITLPPELQDKGWFELLKEGQGNEFYYRYGYLRQIPETIAELRSKQEPLFFMPHDYKDVTFENFEMRCDGHEKAWTLLTHFGPTPPKGLYLWGNYGTGKTHLIAAFARGLQAEITAGTFGRIADFAGSSIAQYEAAWKEQMEPAKQAERAAYDKWRADSANTSKGYKEWQTKEGQVKALQIELDRIVPRNLRRAKDAYPFQPSDIAFATFDHLMERSGDEEFMNKFLSRRIVIIDDVHPKDDRARLDFIQRIVEKRYNEYRSGATFFTSNLSPEKVLVGSNYPKEIGERGHSRLREMTMPIEFDSTDYRLKIAEQADADLLRLVEQLRQDQPRTE